MPDQLQPLRFATGKRVQRLTEPQITESNFLEHFQTGGNFRTALVTELRKELNCFTHRQLEHVMN